MGETLVAVLSAVLSAGFFSFLQYIISRHDNKKGRLDSIEESQEEIKKQQMKNEKDSVRTQLLILMASYPEDQAEIMRLAEYYFSVLKADFYLTSLFQKWLIRNGIEIPGWFES